MKYLVNAYVNIQKPISRLKLLKFIVTAKNDTEAVEKVQKLHYNNGLLDNGYIYSLISVGAEAIGRYWEWSGYHFDTLSDAKYWAANLNYSYTLEQEGHDTITHVVNGVIVSTVEITLDNCGCAKFSRVKKFNSKYPTLA